MSYDVKEVARYIITYFSKIRRPVTHLKLQKLLYFAWVDYYRERKDYLFDEEMAAWRLGPVSLSVYAEYCAYGAMPIDREYKDTQISLIDRQTIDRTLERLKGISPYKLVDLSHNPHHSWARVFDNGRGECHLIPFETIISLEGSKRV